MLGRTTLYSSTTLVTSSRSVAVTLLTCVGHGGQTKDLDGDEEDGYDEVIYPVDFRQVGHIVDDEMHRIMVQPLQAGVRLTAIFDSCHSGTALDLPYIYSTHGILKTNDLSKAAGRGLLEVISSYGRGDLSGVTNSLFGFFKKATTGDDARNRTLATKTSPAHVIMWSGSKDDQTSYVAISFPVTMALNPHMLKPLSRYGMVSCFGSHLS
jgi:metacaspase-1